MAIEVRKTKNGKQHYRVIARVNRRKITKTFSKKRDAENWERIILESGNNQLADKKLSEEKRICVSGLYEIWLEEYANFFQAPSTISREKELTRLYISPYFGDIDIRKITRNQVQDFLNHLAKNSGLKFITINRVRQILQKIYNKAHELEIVEHNPVSMTKKFPEDDAYSTTFNFLSKDEKSTLLKYLEKLDEELFSIVFTLVSTGMRLGECFALHVKDVNLKANVPHIYVSRSTCRITESIRTSTKGKKARIVPIGKKLVILLKRLCCNRNLDGLVFFKDETEALSSIRRIQGKFSRAVKNCGIKRIRVHDLRHTFATQFLENGGNIYSLSKILGHSNTKITEKYSHFSDALKESAQIIMDL